MWECSVRPVSGAAAEPLTQAHRLKKVPPVRFLVGPLVFLGLLRGGLLLRALPSEASDSGASSGEEDSPASGDSASFGASCVRGCSPGDEPLGETPLAMMLPPPSRARYNHAPRKNKIQGCDCQIESGILILSAPIRPSWCTLDDGNQPLNVKIGALQGARSPPDPPE